MRLLYACAHPTLRSSDIKSLILGGFEVVPSFVHIQFRGRYRIDPTPLDNPLNELNRSWRAECSIPEVDLIKILRVDFYRMADTPFTDKTNLYYSRSEDPGFPFSGEVSFEEAHLINKYFDVIVVQSFPNLVPNILKWFKGIVVFRIFGHPDPGFSVWDWYKKNLYSANSNSFLLESNRFISLSVFRGIISTERRAILGNSPCLLNSVVMETIKNGVGNFTWQGERSQSIAVTNISYLDISPIWQKYYEEFKDIFEDIPFEIFGKNQINSLYCKKDARIKGHIENYHDYISTYCKFRVFCNLGKLIQHSQYTPFECAAMGIPVLFLKNSTIGYEGIKYFSNEELEPMGICQDLTEMRIKTQKCLENVNYAIEISSSQSKLFSTCFSQQVSHDQAKEFYSICDKKIRNNPSSIIRELQTPSLHKDKRILWGFYHKTNRFEEVPLWIGAGFEVVPIKMPQLLAKYQGFSYDNESDPMYPSWRNHCSLSFGVVEILREIELIKENPLENGNISKEEIDLLNNHFGYILIPASIPMALNLLRKGYKGTILNRYFGSYRPNCTLAKLSKEFPFHLLRLFPNYIFLPALKSLTLYESKSIAPSNSTMQVSSLIRSKSSFNNLTWNPFESKAILLTSISDIGNELNHYYRNFINFFGHFPYKIYGKNFKEDLKAKSIEDSNIVGLIENEPTLFAELCKGRVYIEAGMVTNRSHYTPLEALIIQIPVVFWKHSGFGTELQAKFDSDSLKNMGMCDTWEEMACLVQKCLEDIEFASNLSKKQRALENFISPSEIISQMNEIHSLNLRIQNKIKFYPPFYFFFARTFTNIMWKLKRITHFGPKFPKKIRSYYIFTKKLTYIGLIIIGLKKDKYNLRDKLSKVKQKLLQTNLGS